MPSTNGFKSALRSISGRLPASRLDPIYEGVPPARIARACARLGLPFARLSRGSRVEVPFPVSPGAGKRMASVIS